MAIAFGTQSVSNTGGATSLTITPTIPSAATVVLVWWWQENANSGANAKWGATSAAAVAMTKLYSSTNNTFHCFYYYSPVSGAGNSAFIYPNASSRVVGAAIGVTGTKTTAAFGTPVTGTGTSTSPSISVGSAAGQTVVDMLIVLDNTTAVTQGAGQTELFDVAEAFRRLAMSYEAGAASVTMSWTITSSLWHLGGVSLIPAESTENYTPTAVTAKGKSRTAQQAFIGVEVTGVIPLRTRVRNYKMNTKVSKV